jgi:uroporphyrin-3 C-methyltransferase
LEDKTESSTEDTAAAPAQVDPVANTEKKVVKQGAADNNNKTVKVRSTGLATGMAILAVILAIAAVAVSFYLWQVGVQQQQQLQRSQADISAALQRIDVQVSGNRQLQRQLDQQNDGSAQLQKNLQQQISQLFRQQASQKKSLLSLSTTDRADWLLAEAEYLIRLANQRLLMGKEVQGALDLLKAADEIAKELDDSGLYPLRQALADDMAALRSAGNFDLEGIYLQLGAVAKQSGKLQLIAMPQLSTVQPEAKTPATWQQRLDTGIRRAWEKLSSYIQIKRRDEIYKPLLAPEYEAAVRQNVRLMFEQAQMATLAGQQQLYKISLAKAQKWLSNYYTLEADKTAVVIDAIQTLSELKIEVSLPDISGSLRALKNYQESLHSITSEPKNDSSPVINNLPATSKESM